MKTEKANDVQLACEAEVRHLNNRAELNHATSTLKLAGETICAANQEIKRLRKLQRDMVTFFGVTLGLVAGGYSSAQTTYGQAARR